MLNSTSWTTPVQIGYVLSWRCLWTWRAPLTGDWWAQPKKPVEFVNSLSQAVWFSIREVAFRSSPCSCWLQHAKTVLARGVYLRSFYDGISLTFDAYFMHFIGFAYCLAEVRTAHSGNGWGFFCWFLQNQGACSLLCWPAWLRYSDLKSMRVFLSVLCDLRYE